MKAIITIEIETSERITFRQVIHGILWSLRDYVPKENYTADKIKIQKSNIKWIEPKG
jgi:hypothetical protein